MCYSLLQFEIGITPLSSSPYYCFFPKENSSRDVVSYTGQTFELRERDERRKLTDRCTSECQSNIPSPSCRTSFNPYAPLFLPQIHCDISRHPILRQHFTVGILSNRHTLSPTFRIDCQQQPATTIISISPLIPQPYPTMRQPSRLLLLATLWELVVIKTTSASSCERLKATLTYTQEQAPRDLSSVVGLVCRLFGNICRFSIFHYSCCCLF